MSNNDAYLEQLVAGLDKVATVAAAIFATEIYKGVVLQTHIDSGQAALNWHVAPYVGDPTYEGQQILWGYGSVAPTAPAGYKWSKGSNTARIQSYLFEQGVHLQLALETEHFDGIVIYNPITPGFSGFTPGSDEFYEEHSLGDAHSELENIIQNARQVMEERMATEFNFVSIV